MNDVENFEKLLFNILGFNANIKNEENTNSCIDALNSDEFHIFNKNFIKILE